MPKEGRTKGKLSVTVDKKLLEDFYKHCDDNDKSYSKVVQTLIEEYMKKLGSK